MLKQQLVVVAGGYGSNHDGNDVNDDIGDDDA